MAPRIGINLFMCTVISKTAAFLFVFFSDCLTLSVLREQTHKTICLQRSPGFLEIRVKVGTAADTVRVVSAACSLSASVARPLVVLTLQSHDNGDCE